MICWFSSNHWNCKGHRFSFLVKPLGKISCTFVTTIMRSPTFVLIANFANKVMVICLFNHCSYVALLQCKRDFTTNVIEVIWAVHTNSRHLFLLNLNYDTVTLRYLTNVILEAVCYMRLVMQKSISATIHNSCPYM